MTKTSEKDDVTQEFSELAFRGLTRAWAQRMAGS